MKLRATKERVERGRHWTSNGADVCGGGRKKVGGVWKWALYGEGGAGSGAELGRRGEGERAADRWSPGCSPPKDRRTRNLEKTASLALNEDS